MQTEAHPLQIAYGIVVGGTEDLHALPRLMTVLWSPHNLYAITFDNSTSHADAIATKMHVQHSLRLKFDEIPTRTKNILWIAGNENYHITYGGISLVLALLDMMSTLISSDSS